MIFDRVLQQKDGKPTLLLICKSFVVLWAMTLAAPAQDNADPTPYSVQGAQDDERYKRPCPELLSLKVHMENVSADGHSDGRLTVDISGGQPPYTCQWSGIGLSQSGTALANLSAGDYYLVVIDAQGCDATWRGSLASTTTTGVGSSVGKGIENGMLSIAPNPAAGMVTISYALAADATVRLEISDQLGRLLGTPVSAVQTAGRYTVAFDAAPQSAGVYYCRLHIDSELITRNFVVQH